MHCGGWDDGRGSLYNLLVSLPLDSSLNSSTYAALLQLA